MFGKQRVSSQTVGETKKPWRGTLKSMHRKFEMQTTLLNMFLTKLIATILQALRKQLKENDQLRRFQAQYQKSLLSMTKS